MEQEKLPFEVGTHEVEGWGEQAFEKATETIGEAQQILNEGSSVTEPEPITLTDNRSTSSNETAREEPSEEVDQEEEVLDDVSSDDDAIEPEVEPEGEEPSEEEGTSGT